MTPETSTTNTPSKLDVPVFPHHAASPQTPFEAAERQYADRPTGAPDWQPEEGDFT
jgi:hypothetical protein